MKILRRVNLIESKNKTNKITGIGVDVQNKPCLDFSSKSVLLRWICL